MLFKEYTYSVLIVSSSEKFAASLTPLLPENQFGPIESVKNVGEATFYFELKPKISMNLSILSSEADEGA